MILTWHREFGPLSFWTQEQKFKGRSKTIPPPPQLLCLFQVGHSRGDHTNDKCSNFIAVVFKGRTHPCSHCHVSGLQTHHHASRPPSLLAECSSSSQRSRIIYLLFHFHTCSQLQQPTKTSNLHHNHRLCNYCTQKITTKENMCLCLPLNPVYCS